MTTEAPTLITAGTLAKVLGVSDAKIKKAIRDLGLVPTAKKGCCNYYTTEDEKKLKAILN